MKGRWKQITGSMSLGRSAVSTYSLHLCPPSDEEGSFATHSCWHDVHVMSKHVSQIVMVLRNCVPKHIFKLFLLDFNHRHKKQLIYHFARFIHFRSCISILLEAELCVHNFYLLICQLITWVASIFHWLWTSVYKFLLKYLYKFSLKYTINLNIWVMWQLCLIFKDPLTCFPQWTLCVFCQHWEF